MLNDRALEGKRALVLGGGGEGNGRAIVRAAARAGAAVAVVDIDEGRAKEAADELLALGQTGIAVAGDIRQQSEIERIFEYTVHELGGLDVLFTVAGGHGVFAPWIATHETTDEDWDAVYDVNLRYVFRAARSALKVFLDQGTGGSIVSLGAMTGVVSSPMSAAYGASKAGLMNFARTVALEYARKGVRMNVVSLGLITTAVSNVVALPNMADGVPMGRPGTAEEVADAAVYLASPLSGYITGHNLVIDGGATVRMPLILPNAETYMAG